MKYSYTIRYNEVDPQRRLRPNVLVGWLLDTAGKDANAHGIGVQHLTPRGLAWVLTVLNAEVDYLPTIEDTVEIETWIESNAHGLSFRNFRITLDGKQIAVVRSVWAIINMAERKAVNVFHEEPFASHPLGERVRLSRPLLPADNNKKKAEATYRVEYCDIDYNGHCNSCKYWEYMLNTRHSDNAMLPLRLEMKYAQEIMLGEQVTVVCTYSSTTEEYEVLNNKGEVICTAKINAIDNKQ